MPTPNLAIVSDNATEAAGATAPTQATAAAGPSPDAKMLAKIFELNREVARCEEDYLAKKETAANAKKRWEAAQEWLNTFINKNEFPLLDKPADDADAPPAEPWRDTPVGALAADHGLPSAVASRLADAGLATVGALADWTNGGSALTDVKGVGEKAAGQIEDALTSFWEANAVEEAGEAGPEGEGEPDEEDS